MNLDVMYSSKTEVWGTPQDFFDKLNEEFHFNLDPCALPENAKCSKYFTPESDGLSQDWGGTLHFVTHLMVESYTIGLRNVQRKAKSQIQRLLCLSRQGLILSVSMNLSIIKLKK